MTGGLCPDTVLYMLRYALSPWPFMTGFLQSRRSTGAFSEHYRRAEPVTFPCDHEGPSGSVPQAHPYYSECQQRGRHANVTALEY